MDQGQRLLRFLHARPVVLEFGTRAFPPTIVLGALLPLFLSLTLIQTNFLLPDRLGMPTTTAVPQPTMYSNVRLCTEHTVLTTSMPEVHPAILRRSALAAHAQNDKELAIYLFIFILEGGSNR